MLNGLIAHIKVNYMSKLLPNQVYAGLFEILKDKNLYYQSGIDSKYDKFTEKGEEAVLEWLKFVAPKMLAVEKAELDLRAKQLVIDELKK
jgi:hypothetical protein